MTSKRLGMVIAAAFVLWSLTTFGWFAPTPDNWTDDILVVGTAYAGDPDTYEDGNDPDTNEDPGENPPSEPEPPPSDEDQSGRDDVTQAIASIVSLLLWGIGGTTL
jgi:hypothetical protein